MKREKKYDPVANGALCSICPLRGSIVVPPEGPDDPDMVIVGEGPGDHEEKTLIPFKGPSGDLLNSILKDLEISRKRVWVTNSALCRCRTPGMGGKNRFDAKIYMAWLRKENARLSKEAKKIRVPFTPIKSPFDCCKPRLQLELDRAERVARERGAPNGAVVVPMGNFAVYSLLGKQGIMKLRGSVNVL